HDDLRNERAQGGLQRVRALVRLGRAGDARGFERRLDERVRVLGGELLGRGHMSVHEDALVDNAGANASHCRVVRLSYAAPRFGELLASVRWKNGTIHLRLGQARSAVAVLRRSWRV